MWNLWKLSAAHLDDDRFQIAQISGSDLEYMRGALGESECGLLAAGRVGSFDQTRFGQTTMTALDFQKNLKTQEEESSTMLMLFD